MAKNAAPKTIDQLIWPSTDEFGKIAGEWKNDAVVKMLNFVWSAYDKLVVLIPKDRLTFRLEEVERGITQLLFAKISAEMDGFEPYDIIHGAFEFETRKKAPAQSPQYDLAFMLKSNNRIMWPLEAKKMMNENSDSDYIDDIKNQFLTCRYAPLSSSGAMMGYLLSGNSKNVLSNIENKIGTKFVEVKNIGNRSCKMSNHIRTVPAKKKYPKRFSCYHLILDFPMLGHSNFSDSNNPKK